MKLKGRAVGICIISLTVVICLFLFFKMELNLREQDLRTITKSEFIQNYNSSNQNSNKEKFEKVIISAEEFRESRDIETGNILIDKYGSNDHLNNGENGRGITFVGEEKKKVKELLPKYRINVLASDLIPLNRLVPDSRPPRYIDDVLSLVKNAHFSVVKDNKKTGRCKYRTYAHDLPTTSVIIPFYDEWPSVLIRTVYSIINRTPRHLLQEIILVDDNSQMTELKRPLDEYINDNFPKDMIKIVRNPKRVGAATSRVNGWRASTGQVAVFFDSQMEVNIDWCKYRTYAHDLPTTSVIIPFYDEWPSVLIRTVYSIINRTPRHLLQEIILVDDNSQMTELKRPLDEYINDNFPKDMIKIVRNPKRVGAATSRVNGWRASTGQVAVFFDSQMEVNIDWLQPLLTEVKKDRNTIAMAVLDYVNAENFEYYFYEGHLPRYGFEWKLGFFETFFRKDQIGATEEDARPGTVMVGAAYAADSKYFGEIGTYDEGMYIWGGENLEMSWRVWMCGGRLIHIPCSHIGHIPRSQPYSFPGGRRYVEVYNYKRAVEVWMEPKHRRFVYDSYPEMATIDAGDLSERFKLKEKLQCKNFTCFLTNIWQELFIFDDNVFAWGSARNIQNNQCLDNHSYLYPAPKALYLEICHYKLETQGFSWTKEKLLRTTLQCVVVKDMHEGTRPVLEGCIIGPRDKWDHKKSGYLKHIKSGLCLDHDGQGPIMRACNNQVVTQNWQFNHYNY